MTSWAAIIILLVAGMILGVMFDKILIDDDDRRISRIIKLYIDALRAEFERKLSRLDQPTADMSRIAKSMGLPGRDPKTRMKVRKKKL